MEPSLDTFCAEAAKLGSFCIAIRDRPLFREDMHSLLPLHQTVLLPLISASIKCKLYGPVTDPILLKCLEEKWRHDKRDTFELLDQHQPIEGQEAIWNASCRLRGSILITIPNASAKASFEEISFHASKPFLWSSLRQLRKGNTAAAITAAQKSAVEGLVTICLPANNGCQWLDVFANEQLLPQLISPCFDHGDNKPYGIVC